jgi:hypothetical protein
MFNEIQMHKTGTDGKKNSESLCWYTAQPRSNTVRRQGRHERKWRPSKTGEPFERAGFIFQKDGAPPHFHNEVRSELNDRLPNDGLAVLVLMMMNFCVGLHVHLT